MLRECIDSIGLITAGTYRLKITNNVAQRKSIHANGVSETRGLLIIHL